MFFATGWAARLSSFGEALQSGSLIYFVPGLHAHSTHTPMSFKLHARFLPPLFANRRVSLVGNLVSLTLSLVEVDTELWFGLRIVVV